MRNKRVAKETLIHAIEQISKEGIFHIKDMVSIADWIELKEAVSPINNFITKELTQSFIKELKHLFPNDIDEGRVAELLKNNENANVNANGYDFILDDPGIIAEIKANRPYQKEKYGQAQITGISKDISGLLCGKCKEKLPRETSNYYKFQIMLKYEKNGYSSVKAIKNYIDRYPLKDKLELIDCNNYPLQFAKEKVYLILLDV